MLVNGLPQGCNITRLTNHTTYKWIIVALNKQNFGSDWQPIKCLIYDHSERNMHIYCWFILLSGLKWLLDNDIIVYFK